MMWRYYIVGHSIATRFIAITSHKKACIIFSFRPESAGSGSCYKRPPPSWSVHDGCRNPSKVRSLKRRAFKHTSTSSLPFADAQKHTHARTHTLFHNTRRHCKGDGGGGQKNSRGGCVWQFANVYTGAITAAAERNRHFQKLGIRHIYMYVSVIFFLFFSPPPSSSSVASSVFAASARAR